MPVANLTSGQADPTTTACNASSLLSAARMHRAVPTPAARAFETTSARSSAKTWSAKWQWVSISIRASANLRAGRRWLFKVEQDRAAAFGTGRKHHPVRLDAHQLRWLQIRD